MKRYDIGYGAGVTVVTILDAADLHMPWNIVLVFLIYGLFYWLAKRFFPEPQRAPDADLRE